MTVAGFLGKAGSAHAVGSYVQLAGLLGRGPDRYSAAVGTKNVPVEVPAALRAGLAV